MKARLFIFIIVYILHVFNKAAIFQNQSLVNIGKDPSQELTFSILRLTALIELGKGQ